MHPYITFTNFEESVLCALIQLILGNLVNLSKKVKFMTPKAIWQRIGKPFLLLVTLQILLLCFFSSPQTFIKITRRPVDVSSYVSVAKAESIGITSTVHLPLVLVYYRPTLPPIVPDTTVVISDTAGSRLTAIATDASVLTFTQSLTQPLILTPGNVLVSTSTTIVPNGLLRKITSVNIMGEQLVVQTTAATLDEALQQGEVHISQPLSPSNIQSAHYSDGVHQSASSLTTQATIFYLEIDDVVIFDKDKNLNTTHDQILANGSIEVEPTLNFDLLIRDWQIQQVHFSLTTSEKVDIEFQSKIAETSLKWEKELARYQMPSITAMVGVVPVVFTPILILAVGIDGDVHVSLSTGVTQQATLTGGLQYSNGSWGPVSEYTNSFQVHPPTISVGGDLKGYTGPRLQMLLYGAVGPQIKLDGYVKLEADSAAIPWWKVYGGLV